MPTTEKQKTVSQVMAEMDALPTPECDRWSKVHNQASAILEFLSYLESGEADPKERSIFLAMYAEEGDNYPISAMISQQKLVYDYFDIDPNKLEDERRELLRLQGELNDAVPDEE